MPTDLFSGQHGGLNAPYRNGATITPHNSNELAVLPRALMAFTTAGIAVCVLADDPTTTEVSIYLPLGVPVPVRARIVKSTGLTAAGITALW